MLGGLSLGLSGLRFRVARIQVSVGVVEFTFAVLGLNSGVGLRF